MRDYADCVDTLHPDPLSGGTLLLLKLAVAVVLAGAAIGYWIARNDYDWVDRAMGFFAGAIVAAFVVVTVLGIVAGVAFVF
jgi:uncharacterized membrane protein required for colicin V production